MRWAASEKEAVIELILPDGRVIRLGQGRYAAQALAAPAARSRPVERRRRLRPAFDQLRGRAFDISA